MAKKQASYADWEVIVDDNNKIIVKESGEVLPNSKGALRTIAAAVGFTIEPKWNTQQSGNKLVDFLNSSSTPSQTTSQQKSESAPAPTKSKTAIPQSETAHCPTPKPTIAKVDNKYNEERLTPEDMKKLEDICNRLELVEKRLASIDKRTSGVNVCSSQLYVTAALCPKHDVDVYRRNPDGTLILHSYYSIDDKDRRKDVYALILQGNYSPYIDVRLPEILLLSNGEFITPGGTIGGVDSSLKETKAFAAQIGFEIPEKTTMAALAGEIMREKGRNGWCVGNGSLLTGSGLTYSYTVVDLESLLAYYIGQIGLLKQLPVPSLKEKSSEEKFEIVSNYYSQIINYPLPPKEEVIADFKKSCDEYDNFTK